MSTTQNKKAKVKARILSQTMLTEGIYDLWLETPLALEARAGQFIGIYPKDASRLLPRPLSICEADKEKGGGVSAPLFMGPGKGPGRIKERTFFPDRRSAGERISDQWIRWKIRA